MNSNKILITGVCGHIGSLLVRSLPPSYDIIAVDNMLTQRYSSLFNLPTSVKFYDKNFLDIDIPENAIVIHLAAITDAASSMINSSDVEKINIDNTKIFIDKCIQARVKRFIFPSSTSVYGVSTSIVNEDEPSYENPQSPYAVSKLQIEQYLESKGDKLEYIVMRFGTIFGTSPGMRFHTAINKFCWQSALNQPITIWKENYEQVRPYLGLEDAISSLMHMIQIESKFCNTKYNVLTDNYKLSTIVNIIQECVPDLKIKMINTPLLNQYTYNVDDSKIKSIGFNPKSNLKNEIIKTINLLQNLK